MRLRDRWIKWKCNTLGHKIVRYIGNQYIHVECKRCGKTIHWAGEDRMPASVLTYLMWGDF